MNWTEVEMQTSRIIQENGTSKILKLVHIQAKTVDDVPEPEENWAVGSTCFVESPHKWFTLGIEREWV